jgi:hypothetical protein
LVCGDSCVGDNVPALGHNYVYTDNGDGTHTGICENDRGHIVTSEHTGMDDCICDDCKVEYHVTHDGDINECDNCGRGILESYFTYSDQFAGKEEKAYISLGRDTYLDITSLSTDVASIPTITIDPNAEFFDFDKHALIIEFYGILAGLRTPDGLYLSMENNQFKLVDNITAGWFMHTTDSELSYTNNGSTFNNFIEAHLYIYENVNVDHEISCSGNDTTHTITCSKCDLNVSVQLEDTYMLNEETKFVHKAKYCEVCGFIMGAQLSNTGSPSQHLVDNEYELRLLVEHGYSARAAADITITSPIVIDSTSNKGTFQTGTTPNTNLTVNANNFTISAGPDVEAMFVTDARLSFTKGSTNV